MNIPEAMISIFTTALTVWGGGVILTRRQRLRSAIKSDLGVWERLPEGPARQILLATVEGRTRQLASEQGDCARTDRLILGLLPLSVLVVGLFATIVLTSPGGENAMGWMGAEIRFFAVCIFVAVCAILQRTRARLEAAYRDEPEPKPWSLSDLVQALRNLQRRLRGLPA